ncbi:MAG: hypothetical protein LBH48_07300, partial [Bifidobacteriaceae bacterium]|nr:hypothetical protein [Bifidobacteriaceae bacterium]
MSLATGRSGRDRSRRQRRAAIVGWLTCVALAGMMCTAVPPANAARGPSVQEQSACVGPWLEWGDPGQTADSPHGKAVQVLADRYIDLWMAPDQSGFVVAVSRLSSEEVGPLTAALARQGLGTVTLVHRDFSRTDVNSLATLAARAVNTVGGWTWFGPHYGPGVVDIGARTAECAEQLAAAVKSATGVSPLVGAAADAANLPGWVSSGSPVVTIRIGEVVHLPIIPAPG